MSIKLHYLHSHLDKIPDNLGYVSEEQVARFYQDIKVMEDRYQGRWDSHTVVAKRIRTFCYFIKKRTNESETAKQITKNSQFVPEIQYV